MEMAQETASGQHLEFREMLTQVMKRIDDYTLDSLKYQCRDLIGPGRLEKIHSAQDLFEVLEQRDELDHENTEYLIRILKNIDRIDLSKLVLKYSQRWKHGVPSSQANVENSSKTFFDVREQHQTEERTGEPHKVYNPNSQDEMIKVSQLKQSGNPVETDNYTRPFDTAGWAYSDSNQTNRAGTQRTVDNMPPRGGAVSPQVLNALELVFSKMSRGWQSAARRLGVQDIIIDQAEDNWPRNVRNQIRESFMHWARNDRDASVGKIIMAMRHVGRNDIADDLEYGSQGYS